MRVCAERACQCVQPCRTDTTAAALACQYIPEAFVHAAQGVPTPARHATPHCSADTAAVPETAVLCLPALECGTNQPG